MSNDLLELGFDPIVKSSNYDLTESDINLVSALVYEAGANKDDEFKRRVASTVFNRYDSKSKEFGAESGNISNVVNHKNAYYETNKTRFKDALKGKFDNELEQEAFNQSRSVVEGIMNGDLEKADGKFWFNDKEKKNLEKSKGFDFSKTDNVGDYGGFSFYDYADRSTQSLQKKLIEKGYDPGEVDGKWGGKTKKAVKQFQKDRGLNVDGIAGKKTWKELLSSLKNFVDPVAHAGETTDVFGDLGWESETEVENQSQELSKLGWESEDIGIKNRTDFGEALIGGLAHGLDTVGMGAGSFLDYVGNKTNIESIENVGKKVYDIYANRPAVIEGTPDDLKGSILADASLLRNPSWWAFNVADMAPSLAVAMGGGLAGASAGTITGTAMKLTLKKIKKLSLLGGMFTGGMAGGVLEGSSTYRSMLDGGYSQEEAEKAGELMGFATAGLNAISVGIFLTKLPKNFLGNVLVRTINGAVEGITEWLEEPAEVIAKRTATGELTDFPETIEQAGQAIWDGANVLPPSMLLGFLLGGSISSDNDVIGKKEDTPTSELVTKKEEEISIDEDLTLKFPNESEVLVDDEQAFVGINIEERQKLEDIRSLLFTDSNPLVEDGEGGNGKVRLTGGFFAPFLANKGYSSENLRHIFDKKLRGETLAKVQQQTYDDIVEGYDSAMSGSEQDVNDGQKDLLNFLNHYPEITEEEIADINEQIEKEELWDEEVIPRAIEIYTQKNKNRSEDTGATQKKDAKQEPIVLESTPENVAKAKEIDAQPKEDLARETLIPDLAKTSTNKAIDFGIANKDNPQVIQALKDKYEEGRAKARELSEQDKDDEAFVLATGNQMYREAVDAAEGRLKKLTPKNIGDQAKAFEEEGDYLSKEAKKYDTVEEFVKATAKVKENITVLYRGLVNKHSDKFDLSKTDAPSGYSTYTDNPALAREYAGKDGFVYKIELPSNELGKELVDVDGERALFVDNEKGAGLNDVSGKEYLVYIDHDSYSPDLISEYKTEAQLTEIYNKAHKSTKPLEKNVVKSKEESKITPSGQIRPELQVPEKKELFQEKGEMFEGIETTAAGKLETKDVSNMNEEELKDVINSRDTTRKSKDDARNKLDSMEEDRVKSIVPIEISRSEEATPETAIPQLVAIKKNLTAKKKDGGFELSDKEADANIAVMVAGANSLRKHTGESLEQWFERVNPSVSVGGKIVDKDENVLNQESTPTFYSKLEQVIEDKIPNKASSQQIMATLVKAGVKKDEMEWLDVEGFLKGKRGVTKQELLDYVRSNAVEIQEVEKGDTTRTWNMSEIDYQGILKVGSATFHIIKVPDNVYQLPISQYPTKEDAIKRALEKGTGFDPSKFSQWQIPGGENYREFLLMLQKRLLPTPASVTYKDIEGNEHVKRFDDYKDAKKFFKEKKNGIKPILLQPTSAPKFETTFKSGHYIEENILAHVRMNDRKGENGEKILFLEEVQSDWHQKGRDVGYNDASSVLPDGYKIYEDMEGMHTVILGEEELSGRWATEREAVKDALGNIRTRGVPKAPFKKSWHELAMKRMLRYASENGYDKLTWTTGDMQNERYDLSKQVDEIETARMTNGGFMLYARKDENNLTTKQVSSISELESVIGKEATKKLIEQEKQHPEADTYILKGSDLKVGGEGMKGFYDKMIPSFINKYAKKFGARTQEVEITTDPIIGKKGRLQRETVHGIDITESMKETVMNEGQPLFQNETSPKGSIQFKQNEAIISLYESADKSTFLHETAHLFMREMKMLVNSGVADAQLIEDYKTLQAEYGDMTTRNAQEKFARAFESYLRDGKAPSSKLQNAFDMFKEWLTKIYNNLRSLNVTVSQDVKSVMDRLLGEDASYQASKADKQVAYKKIKAQGSFDLNNSSLNQLNQDDAYAGVFELPKEKVSESVRRVMVDHNIRAKALNKEIANIAGEEHVKEYYNLWMARDQLPRKMSDQVRRVRELKMKFIQSLSEDGINSEDLDKFLHARHAKERNAKMNELRRESGKDEVDGLSGMTDKDADVILKNSDPKFQKYVGIIKQLTDANLNFYLEQGMLKEEEHLAIKKSYKYYVPLFRDMGDESGRTGGGRGVDIRGKEIKRAKGSVDRRVISPIANVFHSMERARVRALKNQVGHTILRIVKDYPVTKDLFEVKPLRYMPQYNKDGELMFLKPELRLNDDEIGTKVDGKQYIIKVNDKLLAKSLRDLNLARIPRWARFSRIYLSLWSGLKTRYRPEFLITNFERDLGEALINLGVEKSKLSPEKRKHLRRDILKGLPTAQKEIWRHLSGKETSADMDEFLMLGGDTGHFWLESAKQGEKSIKQLQNQIDNVGIEKVKNPLRAGLDFVDNLNSIIELGIRFSTWKVLVNRGFTKEAATSATSDLTINFSRQGEIAPILKIVYGFINPALQGTDKVVRSVMSKDGGNRVMKSITGLVALGFLTRMISIMIDPEGDEDIPDWSKNHKIALALGDGKQVTLWMMPYGYTTFYSMGSNLAEYVFKKKTINESLVSVFKTANNSFSPFQTDLNSFAPTLIKPLFEIAQNKTWYGGQVYPEQPYDRTPAGKWKTHFKNTSEWSIFTSSMMNKLSGGKGRYSGAIDVHPDSLEYLYNQLLGGPFEFISSTVETAGRGAKGEFNPNKTPFVRMFYREASPQSNVYRTVFDTMFDAKRHPMSELEKDRFYKALDKGVKEDFFDQDKSDGYMRSFIKAVYDIEGEPNDAVNISIIKRMPKDDQTRLVDTYKKNMQRKILKEIR